MKLYIGLLILYFFISSFSCSLYGWNNEHWLGNCDRVSAWNSLQSADYLRLGVLKEGVYRLSAGDIAAAMGLSTNSALASLNAGTYDLSCGTNSVAWTTDGMSLYFFGQRTESLYAPENVYFLRPQAGILMPSQPAPPESGSSTNLWFMQRRAYRSDFLDVTAYNDRRSSNASITNAPVFGMSLGNGYCNRISCAFTAALPGYVNSAGTNINVTVDAISYGDYNAVGDNHLFKVLINESSCGSYTWSGEQRVSYATAVPLATVSNSQPLMCITNLTPAKHILLLDVELEYPRGYQVADEPLVCTGGTDGNIVVGGAQSNSTVMVWNITDPLRVAVLDVTPVVSSNGWSLVFGCGGVTDRYAIFEPDHCYQPSVTGFRNIDWGAAGEIPELVVVTPPRRWVSGFEAALQPLVELRRRQNLTVRVVDAEDIYNAFSGGLVSPHAFQRFVAAGLSAGGKKPLRYLLFAGYASTDYQLETFIPDTVFKSGKKGFPALFPLLQVCPLAHAAEQLLLLPNDMLLGDADGDGVPDIAVGRFLATDAVELGNMVAKSVKHDDPHIWNSAVIVADWNNTGGKYYNFSGIVSGLAADFEAGGWGVDYYYCANANSFTYNDQPNGVTSIYSRVVENNFAAGRDLFYYLGHSNDDHMGDGSYLFTTTTLPQKYYEWDLPPFAICMGCKMGRYTSLDLVNFRVCLMETAAKHPYSAFSGSLSAAGYITFGEAREVSELMADEVNLYKARRWGDAYIAALDQIGAADLEDIQHLVFLGDPSMPVYKPRYPTIIRIQ